MSQRWKSFLGLMQMDVNGLVTSLRKFVGATWEKIPSRKKRNLTLEYVDFLKNQLDQMTQERDLYRKAYLTLESLESPNPPDFSSLSLSTGFEPWSVKKRKIEMMHRKAVEAKSE
jgi:hypothetical protein